jgi:membrane protease YdiL (CAAX protease family)
MTWRPGCRGWTSSRTACERAAPRGPGRGPRLCRVLWRWRDELAARVGTAPVAWTAGLLAIPAALHAAYGAAVGFPEPRWFLHYALYVAIPAALVLHARRRDDDPFRSPVHLVGAALLLFFLLDLGWLARFAVPVGAPQVLDLMRILILLVGILLFAVVAPLRDLGYTFRIRAAEVGRALAGLALLALVLVPLGLAIGFLDYGVRPFRPLEWGVMGVTLYFATTLPEELIFRGVIQNTVEKNWRGRRPELAGLLIGALVFGLAHLNNAPAPNYPYVLMASIAGLVYGWVWMRTRKVTVSALTHLGVNWIWMITLRGG